MDGTLRPMGRQEVPAQRCTVSWELSWDITQAFCLPSCARHWSFRLAVGLSGEQ